MVASVGERNGGKGGFGKIDNWMSVNCLRFSEPTACGKQIVLYDGGGNNCFDPNEDTKVPSRAAVLFRSYHTDVPLITHTGRPGMASSFR